MTISLSFKTFLDKIKIDNAEIISDRYHEITKKLNKTFRDSESETENCLQVGSYGRYTGIKGISDLDMLYIMPINKWGEYKNKPDKLLKDVKATLKEHYPNTKILDDRLVVDVYFKNFKFEVQPVFEEKNGDETYYKYPDTKYSKYKITKPKQEQAEMTNFRREHGDTHRLLSKMIRAWKNNVGLAIGGLVIDTLTHRFLSEHSEYDNAGTSMFGELCRDFFEFLKNEPKKDHYQALGSGQDVKVKKTFQAKAKKAYKDSVDAIAETNERNRNDLWRGIFGRQFPKATTVVYDERRGLSSKLDYNDPEQFIEDLYPVDIRYNVKLDCEVKRNGFREAMLSNILSSGQRVSRVRSLDFILKTDVSMPFYVKWKVRNIGDEAKKRNCLRGEIIDSNRKSGLIRHESADFRGPHYVECYIVKDGIVVARDRISVPIE